MYKNKQKRENNERDSHEPEVKKPVGPVIKVQKRKRLPQIGTVCDTFWVMKLNVVNTPTVKNNVILG